MGVWRARLLRPARNYLERLSPDERNRILDALEQLIKDPETADLRKLQGRMAVASGQQTRTLDSR